MSRPWRRSAVNRAGASAAEGVGQRDVELIERQRRRAHRLVLGLEGLRRAVHRGAPDARQARRQLGGIREARFVERQRDLRRAMELVADEGARQRLRGPGERPSHDGRRHARATKNRPDRLGPKRGRGLQRLGQQAKRHQGVREAEVGQQVRRGAAGHGAIGRRRPHAVAPGQLAGRDGRPHRAGLGRPQRGQVHRRAGVEQAPEIRKPPIGDGRRDEIERGGVHRQQHDAARGGVRRKHRRCLQAPRAKAASRRRRRARPAAGRARPASPARTRRPPAGSDGPPTA